MEENAELISKLGIDLSPFGPGTISIQAFPSLLSKASYVDFVRDLLDMLAEKTGSVDADSLLDEVLNMAACKAAIKVGQRLSEAEIDELLDNREHLEHPSRCPHGRPTTIKFSVSELEKQFGRT
jgi:DNA mismatch repair protein MutL